MSLLNEMLKDLHQRHALPAGVPSGVMAGVTTLEEAHIDCRSGFSRRWYVFPVFAIAAAVAGYAAAPHLTGKMPAGISQTASGTEAGTPAPKEAALRTPRHDGKVGTRFSGSPVSLRMGTALGGTSLGTLAVSQKQVPPLRAARDLQKLAPAPVQVVSARLLQSAQQATVLLELDRSVEFRVYALDGPPRLVLDIPQATASISTAGMIEGRGPVERVRAVSSGDDFRLVLDLAEPVSIRRSAMEDSRERGHRLIVELISLGPERVVAGEEADSEAAPPLPVSPEVHVSMAGPAQGRVAGSMAKTAVQVDRREVAESEYRNAARFLNAGQNAAGEAQLRAALTTDTTHGKARELLGSRLLYQRRYEEADRVLREGLTLKPADVRLHTLYARLLVERGEPERAIAVLQRLSPPLADEPEHHAFRAALLHKTGRHGQAAELYRKLVLVRPKAGVWWMGLAMALEAGGESKPALQAYDRAAGQPNMPATLVRFIKERMRHLQGQPS